MLLGIDDIKPGIRDLSPGWCVRGWCGWAGLHGIDGCLGAWVVGRVLGPFFRCCSNMCSLVLAHVLFDAHTCALKCSHMCFSMLTHVIFDARTGRVRLCYAFKEQQARNGQGMRRAQDSKHETRPDARGAGGYSSGKATEKMGSKRAWGNARGGKKSVRASGPAAIF